MVRVVTMATVVAMVTHANHADREADRQTDVTSAVAFFSCSSCKEGITK